MDSIKKYIQLQIFVSMIVLLIFLIYAVMPRLRQMQTLRQQLHMMKVAAETFPDAERHRLQEVLEEQLHDLNQGMKDIKQATRITSQRMIRGKNIPLATLKVEELSEQAQIELTLVRPLELQTRKRYDLLPLEVECLGRYQDIVQFLSSLEHSDLLMSVQKVELHRQDQLFPKLDVRMMLELVFARE